MRTPVRPITEPIERSMPPVMITNADADGEDAEHRDLAERVDRVRLARGSRGSRATSAEAHARAAPRTCRASRLMPTALLSPTGSTAAAGHQRAPRAPGVRARAVEDALDPPLVHHDDAVAHADDLFHVGADHQDRDALRRPARPCAGRSRPWRPRRCRASARRGSARAAASPATCRARPSAGCRRRGSPPGGQARRLGAQRASPRPRRRASRSRGRASRSARSCRRRGARCSGDRHRQHQAVPLAVLGGEVDAARRWRRGASAAAYGSPSSRIVPPSGRRHAEDRLHQLGAARRRPARRSRGSRPRRDRRS